MHAVVVASVYNHMEVSVNGIIRCCIVYNDSDRLLTTKNLDCSTTGAPSFDASLFLQLFSTGDAVSSDDDLFGSPQRPRPFESCFDDEVVPPSAPSSFEDSSSPCSSLQREVRD